MENEYKELIGKLNIIGARKGLNKRKLAKEIGIGSNAMHSFFNGENKPMISTIGKIMIYIEKHEKENNE